MTDFSTVVNFDGSFPQGNDKEVQYRNGLVFAGASNVEIDSGNLNLIGATPTAPASGITLSTELVAGRPFLKNIGIRGGTDYQQPDLSTKKIFILSPDTSGAVNPNTVGPTINVIGTPSYVTANPGASYISGVSRKRFTTSTGLNAAGGFRNNVSTWFRGDATSKGGFFFRAAFQQLQNLAATGAFVGLSSYNNDLQVNPSTMPHFCGVGFETGDVAGNWFFMSRGNGTVNKVDLGSGMQRANLTELYELIMYMAPAGSELFVKVVNLSTGAVVLDTSYTINIPAVNIAMQGYCQIYNGATVTGIAIDIARMYIETQV